MNASSWGAAYARRKSFGGYPRPAPTPDEVDDRQVDAIDFAHESLDEWLATGMDATMVERMRANLPPRLPKVAPR